jgi:Fe-S cluster assembly protein SufD
VARPLLEKAVSRIDNRFQSLNYALWDHGAFIHVPENVASPKVILIDFVATGTGTRRPHLLVHAAKGSDVLVVQRYLTDAPEDRILMDAAWEVSVGENATCKIVTTECMSNESLFVGNGYADVHGYGVINAFEVFSSGKLVKSRFEVDLLGPGADALMNGLFVATSDRHIDLKTVQRHVSPRAASHSYYYGSAEDEGRTVYQGLIEVAPNASGTDAYLTNQNLILDDKARADSIPSLVIKTNDVRCSHGSSTGKINENQLFYLMSRGFSRKAARSMLIEGFFEDAISKAPEPVRDELRLIVDSARGEGHG